METTWNEQRFGSLYDGHRVALAAYCRRRIHSDHVDDAMAEIFLAAWRHVDQIPQGSELPWLYGVARNVIANQRRSSTRRSRLDDRLTALRSDPAPEPTVDGADRAVLGALATLSVADQELLRLRAWEELTSAEIAVVLGIRRAAVDMRLSRARRKFERALHAAGFTTGSAGAPVATEGLS